MRAPPGQARRRGALPPALDCTVAPHGWAFVDLDGSDLVQTVEYIYPATVANWYREREGDLDVDHWADAAGRQTGIYSIVEQLDGEALEGPQRPAASTRSV